MMRKIIWTVILVSLFLLVSGCGSSRAVSKSNPVSQASVRIQLKDGTNREGIIVKGDTTKLVYVDSKSHHAENIYFADIKFIQKLSSYFDFDGNEIPIAEIKSYKYPKKMLLYGSAGLIIGATVGTGVGIGLYAMDQPLAANVSILIFGALGAWYFGDRGNIEDEEDAAFTARKDRYDKDKAIRVEQRKLDELKQEKERLLKLKEEKEKRAKK